MLFRLAVAAMLAAPLCLAGPAIGREPAKDQGKGAPIATKPASREPAGGSTPGKQRQKACIAEWRSFSATEKTAQGPAWPQFYSKCVKRLKGAQKD